MHNQAHNALVRAALQELALKGYTAYENETGVWFDQDKRPHKFGKKGSADIIIILPKLVTLENGIKRLIGWHCEAEAKTGTGRQNKNQKLHQEFVVERNGGLYFVFHSIEELMQNIKMAAD